VTPKKRQLRRRLSWTVGCLAVVLAFVGDYWAFPYGASPVRVQSNKGTNGLWLRYKWYFGEKSPAELHELPKQLQQWQIRSGWFHVREINKAGRLQFRYPAKAQQLTSELHRSAPGVRAIAWVYVGNKRGKGNVSLSDPNVRRTMIAEAVWLTTVCGFDGVQWDYEICEDNDPDLLNLLKETRAALPTGKILSVAAPLWMPAPLTSLGWSEAYYTKVSALCDEIAVMCYDSGFVTPRSYVWLVAQQAPHITQAVAKGNSRCRVILGVPTYDQGLFSHNPRAENLRLALQGVRQGLANPETDKTVFAGIAPFADYTMDKTEWQIWHDLWLGTARLR
jgi:hypothetical protein